MKAAIAVDDWKVPFFESGLALEGFAFEGPSPGLTPDMRLFYVQVSDGQVSHLQAVVRNCERVAQLTKRPTQS